MFAVVKRLWRHGIATIPKDKLLVAAGPGTPVLDASLCDGCGDCVSECPTDALSLTPSGVSGLEPLVEVPVSAPGTGGIGDDTNAPWVLSISYGGCISCRVCSQVCPQSAFSLSRDRLPVAADPSQLMVNYPIKIRGNKGIDLTANQGMDLPVHRGIDLPVNRGIDFMEREVVK